jgi:hypothetical protein
MYNIISILLQMQHKIWEIKEGKVLKVGNYRGTIREPG